MAQPAVSGHSGEASIKRWSTDGDLEPHRSEDAIRQLTDTKSGAGSADAGSSI
jgi:hypothetical protein